MSNIRPSISHGNDATTSAQDLVTIVIPAYKADRYLGETLNGVSGQTWTNWELIVIEDGSDGKTQRMVEEFASNHPENHVEYHNTGVNKGQAHARNFAISIAQGQFIALLDADDIWLSDHLSCSLRTLRISNADIVYSSSILFDSQTGERIGSWGPDPDGPVNVQEALAVKSFLTPSATVLRREIFSHVGGFDEGESMRLAEDYDFWLRAAASNAQFVHVSGNHCLYRKGHDEALTRDLERLNYKTAQVLEEHIDKLKNIEPDTRNRLLARRLFIAGLHNIQADTPFAHKAFRRAWQLRRFKLLYAVVYLLSFSPRLLFQIRELTEPLRERLKRNLLRH